MTVEQRASVTVQFYNLRVQTMARGSGIQSHPRYRGIVRLPGDREVYRCCGRHQKAKAARVCGERLARRLMKKQRERIRAHEE